MTVAKNGSLKSRTTAPISIVDAPRRLRACGFGRYPSSRAATITRSRVSAAIGTRVGASLSTRDTVLWETPATLAMSRMVGMTADCRCFAGGSPRLGSGSLSSSMSSMQA